MTSAGGVAMHAVGRDPEDHPHVAVLVEGVEGSRELDVLCQRMLSALRRDIKWTAVASFAMDFRARNWG